MMRNILKRADGTGTAGSAAFGEAVDEEDAKFDAKIRGEPPPGSSERQTKAVTRWYNPAGWNEETLVLGAIGAGIGILVAIFAALFYALSRMT